jgi:hypothetical protein
LLKHTTHLHSTTTTTTWIVWNFFINRFSSNAGFSECGMHWTIGKEMGRNTTCTQKTHYMNRKLGERSPKLGSPRSHHLTTSDIFPCGYINAQVWDHHPSPTMNPWRSVYNDCCSCYHG